MRQNRLAQILDMDETLLSKIVNGFREPSPQVRTQIARILGSDERWLFEWQDVAESTTPRSSSRVAKASG